MLLAMTMYMLLFVAKHINGLLRRRQAKLAMLLSMTMFVLPFTEGQFGEGY